ncbi:MAG: hypothetical protein HKN75_04290 [Bacteroidia bacterium]|nr:hypothetical protein [Bacteroidia bacterium]
MKVDKSSLDQAHLTISKDGSPFKTGGVEKNGKFNFILQFNHVYLFTFSKPGFVTKKILIDTHIPDEVAAEGKRFDPFEFIVTVFSQTDTENKYTYNQPVARIHYSEFIEEFDYDTDYTKSMQARFDADKEQEKEKDKPVEEPKKEVEEKKEEVKVDEEPKSVAVISPRGGTVTRKEVKPKVDVDARLKIQANADKDKRQVIRPGVAVDKKPKPKPIPKINPDAKSAPPNAGTDEKPEKPASVYRHKTVDTYREHNMDITLTVFTIDADEIIYKKVKHDWGGVFYFKDGVCVGSWVYESEIAEYNEKQ